jgi:hypothetical protein
MKLMKHGKIAKGLKHHGWVMGHGWGLHGGTWKMGACMGPKHSSQNFACFNGWYVLGLKLPGH